METVEFWIPGAPKPHPRPRAFARGGRAHVFTPKPAQDRKYLIQMYAREAYREGPHDGPVTMVLEFVFPRPKNRVWKTKAMPREPLAHGPDVDNLAKSVMDALNGILYQDDRQVFRVDISKWTASGSEGPYTFVRVKFHE